MISAGPFTLRAKRELVAQENPRCPPFAVRKETRGAFGLWRGRARLRLRAFGKTRSAADRLDIDRFDHQVFGGIDEPETRLMRGFESAAHRRDASRLHFERGVRTGVAQLGAHMQRDIGARDALARNFRDRLVAKLSRQSRDALQRRSAPAALRRPGRGWR